MEGRMSPTGRARRAALDDAAIWVSRDTFHRIFEENFATYAACKGCAHVFWGSMRASRVHAELWRCDPQTNEWQFRFSVGRFLGGCLRVLFQQDGDDIPNAGEKQGSRRTQPGSQHGRPCAALEDAAIWVGRDTFQRIFEENFATYAPCEGFVLRYWDGMRVSPLHVDLWRCDPQTNEWQFKLSVGKFLEDCLRALFQQDNEFITSLWAPQGGRRARSRSRSLRGRVCG
jgi:hypothetical protein